MPRSRAHVRTVALIKGYNTTHMQIHHHCQIMPTTSGPDAGDITTPNLVRLGDRKLPLQQIRDFHYRSHRFLVFMPRLRLYQVRLCHQSPDFNRPAGYPRSCNCPFSFRLSSERREPFKRELPNLDAQNHQGTSMVLLRYFAA